MAPAQSRARTAALAATLAGVAVLLGGCGGSQGGDSTTATTSTTSAAPTQPPGPVECSDALKRGHCTKCYFTGGASGSTVCQECSSPYTVNSTTNACTVSCSSLPRASEKPAMPDTATSLNGVAWPSVCWDDAPSAHFFTIGDWGGVCSWADTGNVCDGNGNPMQWDPLNKKYWPGEYKFDPFPMNNRQPGAALALEDYIAQHLVRDRMAEKVKNLTEQGEAPKFVINVGDNFYPGGVDVHCGTDKSKAFEISQFAQVFEAMYPVESLTNMEWWSVLGNHDYGGTCAIKGWDQQIFYTWKPDGRWVMPGQYWQRRVQFQTFSVDFYFLDSNVYDTKAQNPGILEKHDICSPDNTGREPTKQPPPKPPLMGYCPEKKFPPPPGQNMDGCAATGPVNLDACDRWFMDMWAGQHKWFLEQIAKSDADWQIVVTHYPAGYNPGTHESVLIWPQVADEYGIDLIISGHTHEQRVIYKESFGGADLGDTAWVITGGGGGVTAEGGPSPDGDDDTYGFMDMKISVDAIEITAISHGGREGRYIERNRTRVTPRAASGKKLAQVVV